LSRARGTRWSTSDTGHADDAGVSYAFFDECAVVGFTASLVTEKGGDEAGGYPAEQTDTAPAPVERQSMLPTREPIAHGDPF